MGADRGQIRAMIFWEALLLTAAGEVLGLACGFALSWLLVYVINYQSFGWTFIYAVDWGMLGLSVPLIVGAALGAAIIFPTSKSFLRQEMGEQLDFREKNNPTLQRAGYGTPNRRPGRSAGR